MLTVRLFTSTTIGTMNLYSSLPSTPDPVVVRNAEIIAAHASALLAHLTAEECLRRTMHINNVIGQAQGILMQRHGLTPQQAFGLLRSMSQQHGAEISDLAEHLVAKGAFPDLPLAESESLMT